MEQQKNFKSRISHIHISLENTFKFGMAFSAPSYFLKLTYCFFKGRNAFIFREDGRGLTAVQLAVIYGQEQALTLLLDHVAHQPFKVRHPLTSAIHNMQHSMPPYNL